MTGLIEKSPEIRKRRQFGPLCNRRQLVRHAVEIGTDRGVFASMFLDGWRGRLLWCVDPWTDELAGYEDMIRWPRLPDFLTAVVGLAVRHFGRVRFLQTTSDRAIDLLRRANVVPDFVYVDGNHAHDAARQDMERYWAILSDNGILAGHDFEMVEPVVREFADRIARRVYVTHEPANRSWYIYKQPNTRLLTGEA